MRYSLLEREDRIEEILLKCQIFPDWEDIECLLSEGRCEISKAVVEGASMLVTGQ